MAKLDVKACGFALGIVTAGVMLVLGAINMMFFWAEGLRRAASILYLGYEPTLTGVIFCSMWSFVYASLLGISFAWLYNRIVDDRKTEIDEKIKKLAHEIWEKKGGNPDDNWKEAVRIIKGE